ncbi:MAG: hypothetical protein OYH77_07005 [Pseudomonadota bacterium]|nr:hypothetical protein [Pseudomonadota bacterium]
MKILIFGLFLIGMACQQTKEPLLECAVGDPICETSLTDGESTPNGGGNDRTKKTNSSTPLGPPGGNLPHETVVESPAAEENEEAANSKQPAKTQETGTQEEPAEKIANPDTSIAVAQSGVTVDLTLTVNDKNGSLFHLTYSPFADVKHRSFSIGINRDKTDSANEDKDKLVVHKFTTDFKEKLILNQIQIPVMVGYEHGDSTYCGHLNLSAAFGGYRSSLNRSYPRKMDLISSAGECF